MENLLDCGHSVSEHSEITTGYGKDTKGHTFCYECCAKEDKRIMDQTGKYLLYLVKRDDGYHVTNWPNSLDYKVTGFSKSFHNMAGENGRTDVWFKDYQGKTWHGYQIGQWNELCYVKRNK